MATHILRQGFSIAREAIQNTGRGERALYVLLLSVGALLIVLGWRADVGGWATGHPYFVGLLDGATGFCFGVPIAGVVIREITRRTSESAERRTTIRTVIAQLDYLDRLVERLSPGPIQSASDRLRHLAGTARSAAPGASAPAKEAAMSIILISMGALAVLPQVDNKVAAQLRRVVEADRPWASVGYSCSQLAIDVSRLVTVLHPPAALQAEFPDWLDELISAVQTLNEIQLPAHRRWLPAAVADPPATVRVAAWTWAQLPEATPMIVASTQQADQPADASERKRLLNAAQDRATNELRDELTNLGHHLDALAGLVNAAAACRRQLKPMEGR